MTTNGVLTTLFPGKADICLQPTKDLLLHTQRTNQEITKGVSGILGGSSLIVHDDLPYKTIISNERICTIIDANPLIWVNMRQKMKSYDRKNKHLRNPEQKKINLAKLENDLLGLFLLPREQQGEGNYQIEELRTAIKADVIENDVLWEQIKAHTPYSFIEQPIEIITQLDKNKRPGEACRQIEYTIERALKRNFFGDLGSAKENPNFSMIHDGILEYANYIYHCDILEVMPELNLSGQRFKDCNTLKSLIAEIAKVLRTAMNRKETEKGFDPGTMAAIYLKFLFAWGYLPRIIKKRKEAILFQEKVFQQYDKLFGEGEWIEEIQKKPRSKRRSNHNFVEHEREHRKERRYTIDFKGRTYVFTIASRVKKLSSILEKLVADDTYNDSDSLLDLLGFRTYFGEMPKELKIHIAQKVAEPYDKNAYTFKNKGILGSADEDILLKKLRRNPPLIGSQEKKTRSGNDYTDAKFAGYLLGGNIGVEHQLFNNRDDSDPVGESNHSIIEASRIMQGWMRLTGKLTWEQVAEAINIRCFTDNHSVSGLKRPQIQRILVQRTLTPYLIRKQNDTKSYVLFAYKGYEHLLTKRYKDAEMLHVHK